MDCEEKTSPLLPKEEKTHIQKIVGTLLYISKALDLTMMVDSGTITENLSKSNETTAQDIEQLLEYCATHSDATIR